ncbi:hypothetical protein Nepgr_006425 [Nepenthes gracilis]|uniref:Uncharacterized protein n=1 Tax=Nepenthes gracilis TaxID=150966 RepID=A0AAD3S551_NEPGR|nr:hypothetical protein Nepgr_006425 [Nepenthes gracilis]
MIKPKSKTLPEEEGIRPLLVGLSSKSESDEAADSLAVNRTLEPWVPLSSAKSKWAPKSLERGASPVSETVTGTMRRLQSSYGRTIDERAPKGPFKKSEGVMDNLSLYVARKPPSTSLTTVLAQKDRSFTC